MRLIFTIFFVLAFKANGFIPPVSSILKDIFESRKFGDVLELVFVHQVASASGGWSEVEERILIEPRGIRFLWKPGNGVGSLSGSLEKRTYLVGSDKRINSRSLLFLKSFTSSSAVEFRDVLIGEKFLRWEQMRQFKEGFEPQGDPQTWDIKGNYLNHDSISFVLLPTGPSIAVVGFHDANTKKTIYFDKSASGFKRFEWIELGENLSWNFDPSTLTIKDAVFPKRAILSKNGRDVIQTELTLARPLNKRQIKDWLQLWQASANQTLNNAPAAEEALRMLLSSR